MKRYTPHPHQRLATESTEDTEIGASCRHCERPEGGAAISPSAGRQECLPYHLSLSSGRWDRHSCLLQCESLTRGGPSFLPVLVRAKQLHATEKALFSRKVSPELLNNLRGFGVYYLVRINGTETTFGCEERGGIMSKIRAIAVMLGVFAVAASGCRQLPTRPVPGVDVPFIISLSVCEGDVLLGKAGIPDGTQCVWSYDVKTADFKVLLRQSTIGLLAGSSPDSLIYLLIQPSDDLPTGYYTTGPEEGTLLRLPPFLPMDDPDSESSVWIVGPVQGTSYYLADITTLEGDNRYELWDMRQLSLVASFETHSKDPRHAFDYLARPGGVSHAFGPDENLFLVVESDVNWEYTLLVRVFSIEPFREIGRLPAGMMAMCRPGSAPEEVRLILYEPNLAIASLVCSPKGDDYDVTIELIDVLGRRGSNVTWVDCADDLKLWSTSDPPEVRIARFGQEDGEEVIAGPIEIELWGFDVNDEGTLLVTPAGSNRFAIWSIDFPQIERVTECELVYEPKSDELRISTLDPRELEQTSGQAEAEQAN